MLRALFFFALQKKKSKNRVEYTEDAIRVGASSGIPTYYDKVLP